MISCPDTSYAPLSLSKTVKAQAALYTPLDQLPVRPFPSPLALPFTTLALSSAQTVKAQAALYTPLNQLS